MKSRIIAVAACAGLLASSSAVLGQVELQVDINALSAQASGPFSVDFTGTLHVFNTLADPDFDGNANIVDVLIDGDAQNTGGATHTDFSFEMMLVFDAGRILSGSLALRTDATGSENTYTALVNESQSGSIIHIGGGTFLLGGLTSGGVWGGPGSTFLGVDVTPWAGSLDGYFTQIELRFDGQFRDANTDVDVFMIVPAPASVALLGVGGLLAMRRRR